MIHIDLRKYKAPLLSFLNDGIEDFVKSHPTVEVVTVGLSGTGFHGDLALHFDTAEHSKAFVKQWEQKGPSWYGVDALGKFCNNCEDFAFARTAEFIYPEYPDFYDDAEEPVKVTSLDGKSYRLKREEGDEAFNEAVFPFLKSILIACEPFKALRRGKVLRAGVEMNDSTFVEFWVVDQSQSND